MKRQKFVIRKRQEFWGVSGDKEKKPRKDAKWLKNFKRGKKK